METGNVGNPLRAYRKFKSYYVVWKPIDQDEGFFYDVCLNRTMQYGNLEQTDRKVRDRVV